MREANKFIHGLLYLNRGGHGSLCSNSQQVKIANPQIIYINNPYAFRPPPLLSFSSTRYKRSGYVLVSI